MPICAKCNESFPNYVKIDGEKKNLCSRKYCLQCLPFKSGKRLPYEFKDPNRSTVWNNGQRRCPKCNEFKDSVDFYLRHDRTDQTHSYCRDCINTQSLERQRKLKMLAVEYKGGKCSICSYYRSSAALEFHHLNPNEKDFTLSHVRSYKFDDRIKTELDKCVLLCANCHREVHQGLVIL